VASLKKGSDHDLMILGIGELIRSLMPHNLIDTFILLIHPLVLGSGCRMFADGRLHASSWSKPGQRPQGSRSRPTSRPDLPPGSI
jgi:dihydrofolate reductase